MRKILCVIFCIAMIVSIPSAVLALDVQEEKTNDGNWDHIGFVVDKKRTKTNGYYDYKVAQHTSDYLAWTSSSTNNWENQGANGGTYGRVRR